MKYSIAIMAFVLLAACQPVTTPGEPPPNAVVVGMAGDIPVYKVCDGSTAVYSYSSSKTYGTPVVQIIPGGC